MTTAVLLHDGALTVTWEPPLQRELERWLPRFGDHPPPAAEAARIHVGAGPPGPARPAGKATLTLGPVEAWVERESVLLRAAREGVWGEVELSAGEARLYAPESESAPVAGGDVFSMLTLSSALLLGRLGRTLLHGAAAVDPAGRAWLLVGDTHSGKTTATANLLLGGWGFLSDDNVVLSGGEGGPLMVEGWPRLFHLDEGWERGEITGRRVSVDPASLGGGRWRRTAPLAGLLFPRVEAAAPTGLARRGAGAALAALIRQSPWLMADGAVAARLLEMLRVAASLPAFDLSLGRDSYRDPARLLSALSAGNIPITRAR